MNDHTSESADTLHAMSVFYDLCSGIVALQSAALYDSSDIYHECNARVRAAVQRLIDARSDSLVYARVRSSVLNLLSEALGVEHGFYLAVCSNLRSLPDYAIGEEEAEPVF